MKNSHFDNVYAFVMAIVATYTIYPMMTFHENQTKEKIVFLALFALASGASAILNIITSLITTRYSKNFMLVGMCVFLAVAIGPWVPDVLLMMIFGVGVFFCMRQISSLFSSDEKENFSFRQRILMDSLQAMSLPPMFFMVFLSTSLASLFK